MSELVARRLASPLGSGVVRLVLHASATGRQAARRERDCSRIESRCSSTRGARPLVMALSNAAGAGALHTSCTLLLLSHSLTLSRTLALTLTMQSSRTETETNETCNRTSTHTNYQVTSTPGLLHCSLRERAKGEYCSKLYCTHVLYFSYSYSTNRTFCSRAGAYRAGPASRATCARSASTASTATATDATRTRAAATPAGAASTATSVSLCLSLSFFFSFSFSSHAFISQHNTALSQSPSVLASLVDPLEGAINSILNEVAPFAATSLQRPHELANLSLLILALVIEKNSYSTSTER